MYSKRLGIYLMLLYLFFTQSNVRLDLIPCSKTLQEIRRLPSLTLAQREINVAGAQRAAQPVTAASAWLVSRGAPKTTGVRLDVMGYLGTTATNLQTEYQQCCARDPATVQHGAVDRVMMSLTAANDKIIIVRDGKNYRLLEFDFKINIQRREKPFVNFLGGIIKNILTIFSAATQHATLQVFMLDPIILLGH